MNRLDFNQRFIPDSSSQKKSKGIYSKLTYALDSQPSISGYSAQKLDSSHSGFFNKYIICRDISGSSSTLDDFLVSHLSLAANELEIPEYFSQDTLDQYVPVDFGYKPVDVELTITDLPQINSKQIAQKSPSENPLAYFNLPSSLPVAIVSSSHKDTQQQVQTESVGFKPTVASVSGESLALFHGVACIASDTGKKAKAKYRASDKGKKARAKYRASDKGKKARAKYRASDKGKAARAKARAKYLASDKGKADRAISNAKSNAYRSALRQGFSEELARAKGEFAANAKKAEFSSVPPPLFSG